MPKLVRLYITQVLIGFAVSAVFVGLLLWGNVANLRHLMLGSEAGILALFILWLFNGLVFAGVQFAIRIMSMAEDDDTPKGGRRAPVVTNKLARVRVPAKAESRYNARNLK